jgi:hypothetical protein
VATTTDRPRRPGRPSPALTVLAAWVAFLAVFVVLGLRDRASAGKPVAAAQPRKALVRRVVVTDAAPRRRVPTAVPAPPAPVTTRSS